MQYDVELEARPVGDGASHRHLLAPGLAREAGNSKLVIRDVERSIEFVNSDQGFSLGVILYSDLALRHVKFAVSRNWLSAGVSRKPLNLAAIRRSG